MRTKITVQRRRGDVFSPTYFSYKKGETFKSSSGAFVGWKICSLGTKDDKVYRFLKIDNKVTFPCGIYSVVNRQESKYKFILDVVMSLYNVSMYK